VTLLAPEELRPEGDDAETAPEVPAAAEVAVPSGAADIANPGLTAVTAAMSAGAAAVLIGGLFNGLVATLIGVGAVAVGAGWVALSYRARRPATLQWCILPVLGVVASASAAFDAGSGSRNPLELARDALRAGGIAQPPIPFDPGWRFLLVLLLGGLAAGTTMVAVSWSIAKIAVFLPVPLTFGALVLQPAHSGSLRTGAALGFVVVALVLSFGVDLDQQGASSGRFQARRIGRGLALLAGLLVALVGITQLDFLFPPPKQDQIVPPQKPQLPPPEPDRVLFTVTSDVLMPWRLGTLDVYDGTDWLTPPFDRSKLQAVPPAGAIPPQVSGITAETKTVPVTFVLQDVRDRVLPTAAGTTSVKRPDNFALQVDPRTQVIRLPDALPGKGQTYTVQAALSPTAEALRVAPAPGPQYKEFLDVPAPPVKVQDLLDVAPTSNTYDRLQFIRAQYFKTVVAAGPGKPVSVPPERVNTMLEGDPASPYEITAAEVLLARWAGVPARFGYGYYDGDPSGGKTREIRPRNGATWLEAYFEGHGWVAILGTPAKAQGNLGNKNPNPAVRPSDDLALTVYVPVQQTSIQQLYKLVRFWFWRVAPWVTGLALIVWAHPFLLKVIRRSRRARWAAARGPRERIAVGYLELRDLALDLNLGSGAALPLEFVRKVQPDEQHTELAWLVTRAVWGDLQRDLREDDVVVANEAAASLRRRMRGAQPMFNRVLAAVARTSLRNPTSSEIPNVWWPDWKLPRIGSIPRRVRRFRWFGAPATATALIVVAMLLAGCAQQIPLAHGRTSTVPEKLVPERLDAYTFVRETEAEAAYVKAGDRALVEPGVVYTVHEGDNVQASVQVAAFKRGLLDDGRQRELRDEVLRSVGGSLTLKRVGTTPYRVLTLPDRKVFVYMPPDTAYLVLVVSRPGFAAAEDLFGKLLAYQQGDDTSAVVRAVEIPDPLRGLDTP
jgi:hypothetical protein